MEFQMSDIEQWLITMTAMTGVQIDYESAIKVEWLYLYVEDKKRLRTQPIILPPAKLQGIGKALQKEIYKIRKKSTCPKLYAVVLPSNMDHYKFIIGVSTEEELAILKAGLQSNDRFMVVK
jgi:hypothetical protein